MSDRYQHDGAAIVATCHFHGDTSTQRVWHVTPEIAEAIEAELGEPDAITLMDSERMDNVDVAMSGVPMILGGTDE